MSRPVFFNKGTAAPTSLGAGQVGESEQRCMTTERKKHTGTQEALVAIVPRATPCANFKACLQVAVVELPVRLVHAIQEVEENAEVRPLVERSEGQHPGRLLRLEVLKHGCLLYTSPSPRDQRGSRMPSSA